MSTIGQYVGGAAPQPDVAQLHPPQLHPPQPWSAEEWAQELGTQELSAHGGSDRSGHDASTSRSARGGRPASDQGDRSGHDASTSRSRLVADGPEFGLLRRRVRGFAFPMAALFLLWYLAFVLAASYAPDLMATPVLGRINVGLLAGLAQFVTTFALTTAYVRYAERRTDPLAATLRAQVEDSAAAAVGDADTATIWSTR